MQWGEIDAETNKFVKSDPANSTEHLDTLLAVTRAAGEHMKPFWVKDLPQLFESQGLTNVTSHRTHGPPHLWWPAHECGMTVYDEVLAGKGIPEERKPELRRLVNLAIEESRTGVASVADRIHVVGRKPLAN